MPLSPPVVAAQATNGGTAPAAPPMTMFCGVERFSHSVYTNTQPRKPLKARQAASKFTVNDSSRNDATCSDTPNAKAARGEMRPAGTGREAVRVIKASMSRSAQWFTAPAPPADNAPPRHVRNTSPSEGVPATYIVVTVVNSSSDCTFGFVSVP